MVPDGGPDQLKHVIMVPDGGPDQLKHIARCYVTLQCCV